MTNNNFTWGEVIQRFHYDFDGKPLDVVKYHPWVSKNHRIHTGEPDRSRTEYHCEEMRSSYLSLDALIVAWIAYKRLGLNQHMLVDGLCRALEIYER